MMWVRSDFDRWKGLNLKIVLIADDNKQILDELKEYA